MRGSRSALYIIVSLAIFFGWLLSFPFYGPVLYAVAPVHAFRGFSLPFIYSSAQTLSFLLAGLLLKKMKLWRKLMWGSLGVTLAVNTAMPLFSPGIWPGAMAVLGVCGAFYILGWSYPYVNFVPVAGRLKLMALTMIGANIVYIVFNFLSRLVPPPLVLAAATILLWLNLPLLYFFFKHIELKGPPPAPARAGAPLPAALLLIICLFTAGLYLCSGFMYSIMQPFLNKAGGLFVYYRYFPYIAVLLIMWRFGERLQRYFSIYMGASLLGLAFVSFALGGRSAAGPIMTTGLVEGAYALLDLFIWTALGDLAHIYGAPFQFFGFALFAMLLSILAGELISVNLILLGESYRLVSALFAAASIFLTFSVVPWLNERMHKGLQILETPVAPAAGPARGGTHLDTAIGLLLPGKNLTPRELEITALLLKGLTNRQIAERLIISENTLKSHLKNIYPKFGVSEKRELLSLVLERSRETSLPERQDLPRR